MEENLANICIWVTLWRRGKKKSLEFLFSLVFGSYLFSWILTFFFADEANFSFVLSGEFFFFAIFFLDPEADFWFPSSLLCFASLLFFQFRQPAKNTIIAPQPNDRVSVRRSVRPNSVIDHRSSSSSSLASCLGLSKLSVVVVVIWEAAASAAQHKSRQKWMMCTSNFIPLLVLPQLLQPAQSPQWRTRTQAKHLLLLLFKLL